ncbi:MAG: cobalamin biosynthesis protein [Colwellia sp.]|nr:cobalamin biosynthesis protein [Colwellia sp.]
MPTLFVDDFYQQAIAILPEFSSLITLLLALLLDKTLGEAKRFHYLVGFGCLANIVEAKLNPATSILPSTQTLIKTKLREAILGAIAWCLLVLPLPILYYFFIECFIDDITGYWQILVDATVLYLAIGLNSLHQHAMQIYRPLKSGNLQNARHFTGYIVSRETAALTEQEMSRATVESMLENGHDAVIASLVYFIIGGIPLVILHRLANTLDAMWGYKTSRFKSFGFFAARADDALGFISGKICTLLYALQQPFLLALKNAYQQGNQYKSHNGGWVMAAGATVMQRTLGGSALYHGKVINLPILGKGEPITIKDIPRSIMVVQRAVLLFVLFISTYQLVSCFLYR